MASPSYDEMKSIKRYVWRNFPDVCKPHECLPSCEDILRLLPDPLRTSYRARLRTRELSEELAEADADIIMAIVIELETKRFLEKVDVESLQIPRCPACRKVLINGNSRQCTHCGLDWH